MVWDQPDGAGVNGGGEGFAVPPLPQPPAVPPAPADRMRSMAVALLNLSGLGLGYALVRRWVATAVCWIATGILLVIAMPAAPDGVPGGILTAYLVFLGFAGLHGAACGLRTRLSWPPRSSVAILLGLVLLAAPVGGVVLYDGARHEAVEQMLLGRLGQADQLVQAAGREPFDTAEPDYRTALAAYRDLIVHHPDSRAAGRVPDRLNAYYRTVAAPYGEKKYCNAIAPLKYLRTVSGTVGKKELGALAVRRAGGSPADRPQRRGGRPPGGRRARTGWSGPGVVEP